MRLNSGARADLLEKRFNYKKRIVMFKVLTKGVHNAITNN